MHLGALVHESFVPVCLQFGLFLRHYSTLLFALTDGGLGQTAQLFFLPYPVPLCVLQTDMGFYNNNHLMHLYLPQHRRDGLNVRP